MLSCSCSWDYDNWVESVEEFAPLDTKRARKCQSCKKRIKVGEMSLMFWHWREPNCIYEERRFGNEVPLAPKYLCEHCGEIWMNLGAVGFCLYLGQDMQEALQEYWEMTGFDPDKYVRQAQQREGRL